MLLAYYVRRSHTTHDSGDTCSSLPLVEIALRKSIGSQPWTNFNNITCLLRSPFLLKCLGKSDPIDHVTCMGMICCVFPLRILRTVFPVCEASSYEMWRYGFWFYQCLSLLASMEGKWKALARVWPACPSGCCSTKRYWLIGARWSALMLLFSTAPLLFSVWCTALSLCVGCNPFQFCGYYLKMLKY